MFNIKDVIVVRKCIFENHFEHSMFDIFRKYLEDRTALSKQDFELIESLSTLKIIRKRQYLLQAGDVWKYDAFICRAAQTVLPGSKLEEHIMQFAPENYWIGDRESMTSGLPSRYNIDAIEEARFC